MERFIKALEAFVASLKKYNQKKSMIDPTIPAQNPIPVPIPVPKPPAPSYDFSDPTIARHTVRVICDEEGMIGKMLAGYSMKDVLCACVEVESAFNPRAVHFNKDKEGKVWSTDWGLVQCNDYFWIGMGKLFPSVEYVLDNPEASARWMVRMFLQGKQDMWASFTSGLYKKYL